MTKLSPGMYGARCQLLSLYEQQVFRDVSLVPKARYGREYVARRLASDKGSGGSCGPVYLHGNIATGSHARTKDESEPPFARTRAIARSPVHHAT